MPQVAPAILHPLHGRQPLHREFALAEDAIDGQWSWRCRPLCSQERRKARGGSEEATGTKQRHGEVQEDGQRMIGYGLGIGGIRRPSPSRRKIATGERHAVESLSR